MERKEFEVGEFDKLENVLRSHGIDPNDIYDERQNPNGKYRLEFMDGGAYGSDDGGTITRYKVTEMLPKEAEKQPEPEPQPKIVAEFEVGEFDKLENVLRSHGIDPNDITYMTKDKIQMENINLSLWTVEHMEVTMVEL